jgi:tryptophan synthase alpha chain
MKRIERKFQQLKEEKKCAFIAYICAGDPDYQASFDLLKSLPSLGVDIIELGVPFLDPSGDGPIIENAAKNAIAKEMDLNKTLKMVEEFRKENQETPIVLMSYYNPIFKFGIKDFFQDAKKKGIDGVLIVDLPFEEEGEILSEVFSANLDLIRLIAPTTDEERAKKIIKNASGFLYLISLLGITGTKTADILENKNNLQKLQKISKLPIAIGFGIQTPSQAKDFAKLGADGVVIGSAIVKEVGGLEIKNKIKEFSLNIKNA